MKKKRILTGLLLMNTAVASQMAQAAAPNRAEMLKQATRFPVITVPLVERAPSVDGTLDENEWSGASLLSDLVLTSDENTTRWGLPSRERTAIYLQYNAEALYIGVRCELPAWSPTPLIKNTARDSIGGEDNIDIFLHPDGRELHFGGNAGGNFYERDLSDVTIGLRWNTAIEYKARVLPAGGWEGEFKVPFKELYGRSTPAPGEAWRANFVAVRKTPQGSVASWSFWKGWRMVPRAQNDGWLVFGGDNTAVRFPHASTLVAQKGVAIELAGDIPNDVNVQVELLKKEGGSPSPTEPSVVATLGDWVSKMNIGGSDFWGLTYAQVEAKALESFKPAAPATQAALRGGKAVAYFTPKDEGEYLLRYRLTRGEDAAATILAAGVLPFRISAPVSLALRPLLLTEGMLQVDTDLAGLPDAAAAKAVEVAVTKADKTPVTNQKVAVTPGQTSVEIPAKQWPAGQYLVSAKVVDDKGKVLGAANQPFQNDAVPQWWTQPEGLTPEVPEPWTPVVAKGNTVNVWGREYSFNGAPVPAVMNATPLQLSAVEPAHTSQSLLAAPMEIRAVVNGAPVVWKNERFKIIEQKPSQVVFESVNTAGGLRLTGKTRVEFDGMMRVDFEVSSVNADAPVKLEKLDLVIPFRPQIAEFLSNYRKAPGPGRQDPPRYIGRVPQDPWKNPVFYTQFVGTSEVGLEWFCDSLKGWRLKKPDEACEVVREKDRTLEVFHFVDHEIEVKEPIAITFGLIATPTKPLRKDAGQLRWDQLAYTPPLPGERYDGDKIATEAEVEKWKRAAQYSGANVNLVFWPDWTGVDWFVYPAKKKDPAHAASLKKKFDIAHEAGQKVAPHGGWMSVSTLIPEWQLWGHEMIKMPPEGTLGKSFYACYNSPYTDFMVANFAANARDVGIDGVRFDTVIPQNVPCASVHHGCAWKDHNGTTWPSVNTFAAREFMKRIYRVFHGGVRKEGIVYLPMAGPPINAVDSFVDIHEIGEGNFEKAKTLKEGYPQDDVRVRMVGTAYGFTTSNNLKGDSLTTNQRIGALIVAGADPRLMGGGQVNYYSRGYENSTSSQSPNTVELWRAWEWIDRGKTALWKPYWKNAGEVSTQSPATQNGGKPEVYTSFYHNPSKKRVLLIVTNYEQEPLKDVTVSFDLKKLGLEGAKLYAEDAISREAMDVENGTIKLNVYAQRYRLVQISTEEPRLHESNLGPNLLQNADFENGLGGATVTANPQGQAEAWVSADEGARGGGQASLKLQKTVMTVNGGGLQFPGLGLAAGQYVLSGWIKVDNALLASEPTPGSPRRDYQFAAIGVSGEGVKHDPPQEFSRWSGAYFFGEATPGWQRFVMPFEATKDTNVIVGINQTGVGTVLIDDLEVRRVGATTPAHP